MRALSIRRIIHVPYVTFSNHASAQVLTPSSVPMPLTRRLRAAYAASSRMRPKPATSLPPTPLRKTNSARPRTTPVSNGVVSRPNPRGKTRESVSANTSSCAGVEAGSMRRCVAQRLGYAAYKLAEALCIGSERGSEEGEKRASKASETVAQCSERGESDGEQSVMGPYPPRAAYVPAYARRSREGGRAFEEKLSLRGLVAD